MSPFVLKRRYKSISGETTNKVPCGVCMECLRRKSSGWVFRLLEEAKVSTSVCFLTLTYNDENLPYTEHGEVTLSKRDLQLFMKRLRKRTHNKIKYYACGEYGTKTKRPHYHAIMYNVPNRWLNSGNIISDCWGNGHIYLAPGNELTIRYTAKYIMKGRKNYNKVDPLNPEDSPLNEFSLMSKGLGKSFMTPAMAKYLRENYKGYVEIRGVKYAIPRYFKTLLFPDEGDPENRKKALEYKDEIRRQAEEVRAKREEKFGSVLAHDQWRTDQIRKHQKSIRNERQKI